MDSLTQSYMEFLRQYEEAKLQHESALFDAAVAAKLLPDPRKMSRLVRNMYVLEIDKLYEQNVIIGINGVSISDIQLAWERTRIHVKNLNARYKLAIRKEQEPESEKPQQSQIARRQTGRPRLRCNEWLWQEYQKGRTYSDLQVEYEQRHEKETGHELVEPMENMKKAIKAFQALEEKKLRNPKK